MTPSGWWREVRDDPAARIRLAAQTYALRGVRRPYRPYRRAVVAFMGWQQARGVLNALDAEAPGSPWWRAVNEDLLRDTLEAKLLVEREDAVAVASDGAALGRLLPAPSARSWYLAHNASVSPATSRMRIWPRGKRQPSGSS